jgi:hypothetical protein
MNTQTIPIQLKSKPLKAQGTPVGSALSRSRPTTGRDALVSDLNRMLRRADEAYEDISYYIACFHVKPRRLLTAAAMLNTIEVNQKALTAFSSGVL